MAEYDFKYWEDQIKSLESTIEHIHKALNITDIENPPTSELERKILDVYIGGELQQKKELSTLITQHMLNTGGAIHAIHNFKDFEENQVNIQVSKNRLIARGAMISENWRWFNRSIRWLAGVVIFIVFYSTIVYRSNLSKLNECELDKQNPCKEVYWDLVIPVKDWLPKYKS